MDARARYTLPHGAARQVLAWMRRRETHAAMVDIGPEDVQAITRAMVEMGIVVPTAAVAVYADAGTYDRALAARVAEVLGRARSLELAPGVRVVVDDPGGLELLDEPDRAREVAAMIRPIDAFPSPQTRTEIVLDAFGRWIRQRLFAEA